MTHEEFIERYGEYGEGYKAPEYDNEGRLIVYNIKTFSRFCDTTEIPANIIFSTRNSLDLEYVEEIPDNVQFKNGGHLGLANCKKIGKNVIFKNIGNVKLNYIEALPEGQKFQNRGEVNLPSLEYLSPEVKFLNNGDIKIPKLKEFAKGVEFYNSNILIFEHKVRYYMYPSPKINNANYINLMISQLYGKTSHPVSHEDWMFRYQYNL